MGQLKVNFEVLKQELKQKKYPKIGEGSSRKVFDLKNGYVVKVAKNKKGQAQNEQEIKLFEGNLREKMFCKILDYNEYFTMVIMMKCSKIKSIKQLKITLECDEIEIFFKDIIQDLYCNYNLAIGDLERVCSWGLNNIGQPVLIDYGCTTEVFDKFYRVRWC